MIEGIFVITVFHVLGLPRRMVPMGIGDPKRHCPPGSPFAL